SDPHVPVGEERERFVKSAGLLQERNARHNVRSAARDSVSLKKCSQQRLPHRHGLQHKRPEILVDRYGGAIAELRLRVRKRIENRAEPVRSPKVVVVQESEPPRARLSNSGIACRGDASSLSVPHQLHAWVPELWNRPSGGIGTIVNDDYFD